MRAGTALSGKYRLDKPLGNGGMGQVWQAVDLNLGRAVAVKLIRGQQQHPGLLERFRREARLAAGLQHENVLTVHDSGMHDGHMFIVMELLRGEDLGKKLARHPKGLPRRRVVALALQLAEALAVVHERGIVHRDLKPANLFVVPVDRLKVCDFGLARDSAVPSSLTPLASVMGTPPYIAPEVWLGMRAGPATDLYAVGVILYELLTGSRPFAGSNHALMRQHLDVVPTPPRDRNPAIDDPLNDITLALLAKNPADRPNASALATALNAIQRSGDLKPASGPVSPGKDQTRVNAPIACSSITSNHIEVFVLNDTEQLWHRWFSPGPNWSAWENMWRPDGQVSAVAAGFHDDGHQEIAVAIGGTVHHRWWDNGWSDWHEMPTVR
ncbi:hypothetical protein FDG2_4530 [Candidatus Protofrankia californiensis]|uniref:non-specific serine/threonine protein kinase n=1 Tax=Candidatus Protofrankia californiensis TaxID=1839754 RepID=A0A1C3P6E9_9ACTN|nr:hypothetical protein FDG2_4530 [Candidatus Protofrankia californiensis]